VSEEEERRDIVEMLDISVGDRILDVGCGPGNYTRYLAQLAEEGLAIGIDASESMLEVATRRSRRANTAYIHGDACALPFEGEQFDAVCCVGVIHMLGDPMGALDEMVRVLAPGGRLALMASCGDVSRRKEFAGGVRVFGRDELTTAMRERGLVDVGQRVIYRSQFVGGRKIGD